jgi:prepilin-type N-terminal cleavage/methylation domain-containing protein
MVINNRNGFSLTELIVVMGIFVTVLMITAAAFKTVLSQAGKQFKSAETQIEGIVGLELFRSDLQQAGYGLPRGFTNSRWLFPSGSAITYAECTASAFNGVDPTTLNDAPSGIPRGVMSVNGDVGNSVGFNGSDYLTIKSTVSGVNSTAKKWNYLNYSSTGGTRKLWNNANDLATGERVIVIRSSFLNLLNYKQLVVNGGANFFTTVPAGNFPSAFSPPNSTDTFLVYGVDPDTDLRMPFNRTDYFVKLPPKIQASCAPNTGVLYKAMVNQGDGKHTLIPLLDCVANMQVVYSVATTGGNNIDFHYDATFGGTGGTPLTNPTLDVLWNQLREIRVYILAQDGRKDPGYTYPNQTITVGEFGMGSDIDLATTIGADWNRYHWKVYTIVIQPKSLN